MRIFGVVQCLVVLLTCAVAVAAFAGPMNLPHKMPGGMDALLGGEANAFTRVAAPVSKAPRMAEPAVITVTYHGFPSEAQTAFQYAVELWKAQISSPVPITIDATWAALGTNVLGQSGPAAVYMNYPQFPQTDCWYSAALANALTGKDLDPSAADINLTINSAVTQWYFGIDGHTPAGHYDFVTVVLHELCHGFGFIGSAVREADQTGHWQSGAPYVFDTNVVNGGNQPLADEGYFPDGSAELGTAFTADSLYFAGPATAERTKVQPRLHAPTTWSAASFSHLDEASYPAGHPNSLMTPTLQAAEAIHDPGPMVRGILSDLGWSVMAEPVQFSYALDACIRLVGDDAFLGESIIHDDAQQTITGTVATGTTAAYEVAVRNYGDADAYTLTVDSLPPGCHIRVYDALRGGQEITGDLLDDGWTLPRLLEKAAGSYLRLEVTLDATVAGGTACPVRLTATSVADGTKSDALVVKTVKAALRSVALGVNASGSVVVGTPVTLTATATGGGALEYRFRAGYEDAPGVWRFTELSTPLYQTSNSCSWVPSRAGKWALAVLVRTQGSTEAWQVSDAVNCVVTGPLASVALQPSTARGCVGQPLTLTATVVGGTAPEYRFRAGYEDALGVWRFTELSTPLYQTSNSCSWVPSRAGKWALAVLVREQGCTEAWQVTQAMHHTVDGPLAGVTLELSAGSGRVGQPITMTAVTAGGTAPEYRFRAGYEDTQGIWRWCELSQPLYQTGNSCTWTPDSARRYALVVMVREQGGTETYAVYTAQSFAVAP